MPDAWSTLGETPVVFASKETYRLPNGAILIRGLKTNLTPVLKNTFHQCSIMLAKAFTRMLLLMPARSKSEKSNAMDLPHRAKRKSCTNPKAWVSIPSLLLAARAAGSFGGKLQAWAGRGTSKSSPNPPQKSHPSHQLGSPTGNLLFIPQHPVKSSNLGASGGLLPAQNALPSAPPLRQPLQQPAPNAISSLIPPSPHRQCALPGGGGGGGCGGLF